MATEKEANKFVKDAMTATLIDKKIFCSRVVLNTLGKKADDGDASAQTLLLAMCPAHVDHNEYTWPEFTDLIAQEHGTSGWDASELPIHKLAGEIAPKVRWLGLDAQEANQKVTNLGLDSPFKTRFDPTDMLPKICLEVDKL